MIKGKRLLIGVDVVKDCDDEIAEGGLMANFDKVDLAEFLPVVSDDMRLSTRSEAFEAITSLKVVSAHSNSQRHLRWFLMRALSAMPAGGDSMMKSVWWRRMKGPSKGLIAHRLTKWRLTLVGSAECVYMTAFIEGHASEGA